jgi:hypothetical protein
MILDGFAVVNFYIFPFPSPNRVTIFDAFFIARFREDAPRYEPLARLLPEFELPEADSNIYEEACSSLGVCISERVGADHSS